MEPSPPPPPQPASTTSSAGLMEQQQQQQQRLSKLPPTPLPGTFTSIQRKSFTKQISNGHPGSTDTETLSSTHQQVRRVPILRSVSTTPQSQSSHLESSTSTSSVRHQRTSSTPVTGGSHLRHLQQQQQQPHHFPTNSLHSNPHHFLQQSQQLTGKLSGSLEKLDAPFLGSAIDQLTSTALRMANLRLQSAIGGGKGHSQLPGIDRYSSSSGYDSNNNSNSSLTHYLVNGGGSSTASSGSNSNNNNSIRRIPSLHSFNNNKFAGGSGNSSSSSRMTAADVPNRGAAPSSFSSPNSTSFNGARRNSNSSLRSNCSSSSTATATTTASKRLSYGSGKDIKEEVIHSLDRLEVRVAFLREVAAELLAERTKLTDALAQIEACCTVNTFSEVDLADIMVAVDSLRHRLSAVEITIRTLRSPGQTEALQTATAAIDELQGQLLLSASAAANSNNNSGHNRNQSCCPPANMAAAKQRCLSYISSCSSDTLESCSTGRDNSAGLNQNDDITAALLAQVPIDERFQKTVIQCSLDDQKTIKRRLQAILKAIDGQQPLSTTVGQQQQQQKQ